MPQLINIGSEFINLDAIPESARYKVKIIQQGKHILRIDTDSKGNETPSLVATKVLLTVDSSTGDIIQEQRGFVVEHEILGIPAHPELGKEYVHIPEASIPEDYITENHLTKIRKINYRYDKTTKKLKKKT